MKERRASHREAVEILINKYIDGFPYACRGLDISCGGILLRSIHEPTVPREFYSLEIGLPGSTERLWVWARPVWTRGRRQALRFVGLDDYDRIALEQFIHALPHAA